MRLFRRRPQTVQVQMFPGARKQYDYAWAGQPALQPGELVLIPSNDYEPDRVVRVVSTNRATYKGKLTPITRRAIPTDRRYQRWEDGP